MDIESDGELSARVITLVGQHPAVRAIRLVGSRAEGRATDRSDWDFSVETDDFNVVALALPDVCRSLDPLAQQWDRLSDHECFMLMLQGPVKVDLIFADQPHKVVPPWAPSPKNLVQIDMHFWDWMLWLRSKDYRSSGRSLVDAELVKLFDHLLSPLGVSSRPGSIREAVGLYRAARDFAERRFGIQVPRALDDEVSPSVLS